MCWALNHQNTLEMAQGHISLSISPLFGDLCQHIQKQPKEVKYQSKREQACFLFKFGIFGSFFATTWFVFENQIHFPFSKLNTLV
jgi:hypothetical protein